MKIRFKAAEDVDSSFFLSSQVQTNNGKKHEKDGRSVERNQDGALEHRRTQQMQKTAMQM